VLDAPPTAATIAAAVGRFRDGSPLLLRKRARSGERTIDARRFVRALEPCGTAGLRAEIAIGPEGTLKPSVLVAELLGLPPTSAAALRVHKVATRFRVPAAA
jgi:hypothetical protein